MQGALADFGATWSRRDIWILMGGQDIAIRYRRSVIGPFWISLTMMIFVVSLAFIYAEIFRQPFAVYLAYFASGLLAWNFISAMVTEGCQVVVESYSHLRNIPLPLTILSARMVYRNTLIFLHNLLAILIILTVFGKAPTLMTPLALIGVALYLPLGFFLGVILGPLCARFRDVPQVVANVIQMMFFITPVMWMPSVLSTRSTLIVDINPLNDFVALVREPLLGQAPSLRHYIVAVVITLVAGVFAYIALAFARKRIFLWL